METRRPRGFVETYVLGLADDLPSVNRMLVLFRITHWIFFAIAVICALIFADHYLSHSELWVQNDDSSFSDRQIVQMLARESLWMWGCGISLVSAFITWLNVDVLLNRRVILEQSVVEQPVAVSSTGARVPAV